MDTLSQRSVKATRVPLIKALKVLFDRFGVRTSSHFLRNNPLLWLDKSGRRVTAFNQSLIVDSPLKEEFERETFTQRTIGALLF